MLSFYLNPSPLNINDDYFFLFEISVISVIYVLIPRQDKQLLRRFNENYEYQQQNKLEFGYIRARLSIFYMLQEVNQRRD